MGIFNLTLNQMLVMFVFMVIGFALRKTGVLPENAGTTLSRLETYLFMPAMNFFSQLTRCTPVTLRENSRLIIYGGVIIAVAVALAYPLAMVFVPKAKGDENRSYQHNIYKYAMTFGNFGFMGNFIVLGIWGQDGLFKYTLFYFVITLVCNTWGIYLLIPKEQGKSLGKNIVKGLTAPPTLALVAGCIGGLLNINGYMPEFLTSALSNASNCMGPVAMVLAGVVVGGYNFKSLLGDRKVYAASLLRLIVIPALLLSILKLLGADEEVITFSLIAFALPLGLNTIIYPATYGGDTKTGASMTLISNILGVVTVPIMYYIFIVAI